MRTDTHVFFALVTALAGACLPAQDDMHRAEETDAARLDDDTRSVPDKGEAIQAKSQAVSGARGGKPIASRTYHTCAVRDDGTVWCWGANFYGQLGDGSILDRTAPVQAVGLTGAVGVAVAHTHSCASTASGGVWCWGRNAWGQLGDGTMNDHSTPVELDISGVISLGTGSTHTCVAKMDGTVWCWGSNLHGQLGDGTTTQSSAPVQVQNLPGRAVRVAAGSIHTCAVLADGTAWCWGCNSGGILGNGGPTVDTLFPTRVVSLNNVTDIVAAWYQTCALQANGRASCWGSNSRGEVGDGTFSNRFTPKQLPLEHVTQIDVGYRYACARLVDGTGRCWGANEWGQLGDGTTLDQNRPVVVQDLHRATMIAPGVRHTCALLADGTAACWGNNSYGQLGDHSTTPHQTPEPVDALSGISRGPRMASGGSHTCVLRSNGTARCWGDDAYGQLGVGSTSAGDCSPGNVCTTPTDVVELSNALDIAAGAAHTCAVLVDGTARCWGWDEYHALGDGDGSTTPHNTPMPVKTQSGVELTGVTAIAPGWQHTCALIADGTVRCWGYNSNGQLGDGTSDPHAAPQPVPGLSNVVALSAGSAHTCALLGNGTARCWGSNGTGAVGDGTYDQRTSPVPVFELSNAIAITAGSMHGCALIAGGGARCWGGNYSGQLGVDPSFLDMASQPVAVSELGDAVALATSSGGNTMCAIRTGGDAVCWGSNTYGQCGNADLDEDVWPFPVSVQDIGSIVAIAPGVHHTCALRVDGTAYCWGDNFHGQLGIGFTQSDPPLLVPQQVLNLP